MMTNTAARKGRLPDLHRIQAGFRGLPGSGQDDQ